MILQCCVVLNLGKVTFFLLLIVQLPFLSSSFSFSFSPQSHLSLMRGIEIVKSLAGDSEEKRKMKKKRKEKEVGQ